MTTAPVRRWIERLGNALRGIDDGAVEDGLNRCLRHLVETGIRFVSARPKGVIDGLFRAAFRQPEFELRSAEPVADPEVRI